MNSHEWVEPEEAKKVLELLYEPDPAPPKDWVSLEAIAELSGHSVEEVQATLHKVREAQVAQALRELEEPTHRVERPGHAPVDPLSRSHPGVHFQTVRTILDHLPRVGESNTKKSTIEDKADYDRSLWIALGIFAFVLLVVAIYLARSR